MHREELIFLRKKHQLTQADVAKKAGIQRSYYGLIETGIRNPTLSIATKIAEAFEVSVEEAFPKEIFFAGKCYDTKRNNIL